MVAATAEIPEKLGVVPCETGGRWGVCLLLFTLVEHRCKGEKLLLFFFLLCDYAECFAAYICAVVHAWVPPPGTSLARARIPDLNLIFDMHQSYVDQFLLVSQLRRARELEAAC